MLQIQYHAKFKLGPTLLFAGAASDVGQLLKILRDWNGEEIDLLQRLHQGADVAFDGVTGITLSRAKAEKDSYLEWTQDRGTWRISRRGQLRVVGLLGGLKDSSQPGHQYLDIGGHGGIQIICSKDEYPYKAA